MKKVKDLPRKPCGDCGCQVGEHHVEGCDHEMCTRCGLQKIGCDCEGVKTRERWSGIFYEKEMIFCEKHGYYSYFDFGWIECDEQHEGASHDINKAVVLMGGLRKMRLSKLKKINNATSR